MDLSPRDAVPNAPRVRPKGKKWPAVLVLVVVLGAGGVLVTQFLGSAIDYFCNVDEIGTKDGCDDSRRLRIQGNVEENSVGADGVFTTFTMVHNGVAMPVRYQGDPGGVFQECVPVVVHGRLVTDEATGGQVFDGDRIEVKHSNEYEAQNSDRLDAALDACDLEAQAAATGEG
jgi:cytochrome c-type biogenesis protein CcmE